MRLTSASDANGLTLNMTGGICNHGAAVNRTRHAACTAGVDGDAMTPAVLFDFNGVLVDDEDVHFEAFRRTLAALGVTISHEVYRRYLGYDDRRTIVALLDHYRR